MKKSAKTSVAVFACAAAVSGSVLGIIACGGDGNGSGGGNGGTVGGITVSDDDWKAALGFKTENYDSYTVSMRVFNSYDKSQAEEYGEWKDDCDTYYVDKKNEKVLIVSSEERYDAETKEFVKTQDLTYYFKYNGYYYGWRKNDGADTANVTSLTKAEFINNSERFESIISLFQVYSDPVMKHVFKYNSATEMYEYDLVGQKVFIQFSTDKSVRMVIRENSINSIENSVKDTDSTTVDIPDNVKTDVDNFIAEQSQAE